MNAIFVLRISSKAILITLWKNILKLTNLNQSQYVFKFFYIDFEVLHEQKVY